MNAFVPKTRIAVVAAMICSVPLMADTIEPRVGSSTSITARGKDILTVDVYIDSLTSGPNNDDDIKAFRVTLPCSATVGTGGAGTIEFVDTMTDPSPVLDAMNTDYIFYNSSEDTITLDSGSCQSTMLADFPFVAAGVTTDVVDTGTDVFLGTFRFEVSDDAAGTFTIALQSGTCGTDGTFLQRKDNLCHTVTLGSLTVTVPTGRCCVSNPCDVTCTADVTEYHCEETLGGVFTASTNCTGGCPCEWGSHCDDGDQCTLDLCSSGTCDNTGSAVWGDLVGATIDAANNLFECGGNGQVQTADTLACISAFGGTHNCEPCDNGSECSSNFTEATAENAEANVAQYGKLTIKGQQRAGSPGGLHYFDVYAQGFVNSGNYSFLVESTGGRSGALDVEKLYVDQLREDYIFHDQGTILVTNLARSQITSIATREDQKVSSQRNAYLGTFGVRASDNAKGEFQLAIVDQHGFVLAAETFEVR